MELKQELGLKQTLSQNMILSAKILQMGQLELREYLENLQLENPVIELKEPERADGPDREHLLRRLEELSRLDRQNSQYYQEEEEELRRFEPGTKAPGLTESLTEQILFFSLPEKEEQFLRFLIQNLDPDGYLRGDFPALCARQGVSEEEGERIWRLFSRLEPKGVGARSLRECLLMQLEPPCGAPEAARKRAVRMVSECLEELGKNQMRQIAKKLGCRLEEAVQAGELIRSLNPRPGGGFPGGGYERYLIPDVVVEEKNGVLTVRTGEAACPSVHFNSYYLSLLKSGESPEAEAYIRGKIRQAQWACRCVQQRQQTLLCLAEEILLAQRDFFESGRERLAGWTQKEAAARLGVNESTVSRAVRDKYLQCRWGVFPLSFFFSRGAQREDGPGGEEGPGREKERGAGASAEAVKERLRRLMEREDKRKPLSDRRLAEELEREGISISRRTVAKYREAMGIGDASARKRFAP